MMDFKNVRREQSGRAGYGANKTKHHHPMVPTPQQKKNPFLSQNAEKQWTGRKKPCLYVTSSQ